MKKSKKKVDKIDQETLEQFAKEKNIDKNKIENIANSYQGKSEDELLDELINIGKNLKGKEEVVSINGIASSFMLRNVGINTLNLNIAI